MDPIETIQNRPNRPKEIIGEGHCSNQDNLETKNTQITDEYIQNALFNSAKHLLDASILIKPFNDMYSLQLVKQAELMISQLELFNKSIKDTEEINQSKKINEVYIPPEIKDEVDSLIDSLKDSIGDLNSL